MGKFQSIRVVRVSKNRYCISLLWAGERYRFYNGSVIGSWSSPNKLANNQIRGGFEKLNSEFQMAIEVGWRPCDNWNDRLVKRERSKSSILDEALANKLKRDYSIHYLKRMTWVVKELTVFLKGKSVTPQLAAEFLKQAKWSNAMRNNVRSHYIALESELQKLGYDGSVAKMVRKERVSERLHKPLKNIETILADVYRDDSRLHLCCLLAYGCLLRPHRQIRLLTWGDISEDFSQVSLGGNQNKGKRNRIVPVGTYIKPYLKAFKGSLAISEDNVFTGRKEPYNPDYFKTLWSRYKRKSKLLEKDQTLYSFRHSGAIDIFKRTGSITKLQKAMGHSSINVYLTYLRGLEVAELKEADMPGL